jgi:bile acid:Na+ symporter, BASS family
MDTSIDSIKINFSPDNLLVLNICLALIMFSIALDIKRTDFEILWHRPKPAIVGMISLWFWFLFSIHPPQYLWV